MKGAFSSETAFVSRLGLCLSTKLETSQCSLGLSKNEDNEPGTRVYTILEIEE